MDEQHKDSDGGWWSDLQDPTKNYLNKALSTWQWFARSIVLLAMWVIVLLFWPKSLWDVVVAMPFLLMMLITYVLPLLLYTIGIAKPVTGWWLESDRMATIPQMISRFRARHKE
jgi:hypothetical protein